MAEDYYDRSGRRFLTPTMKRSRRVDSGSRAHALPLGVLPPEDLAQRTKVETLQRKGEVPYTRGLYPDLQEEALVEAQRRSQSARGGGGSAGGSSGADGGSFNNFPSEMTPYTQGNDALRREKRMNEYQRAMMLSPVQREAVQLRMEGDPYDFDASTRLERLNIAANANPYANSRSSQDSRDAAALQVWQAGNARQALPQGTQGRVAPGGGSPFTVGEINGKAVVAPTAGNYNTYREAMAGMGLGDSPAPEEFAQRFEQSRIDPTKRYIADSSAESRRLALTERLLASQGREQKASDAANARRDAANTRLVESQAGKATNALDRGQAGDFRGYLSDFSRALKSAGKYDSTEALKQTLVQRNIPFSSVRVEGEDRLVPLSRAKWSPGISASADSDTVDQPLNRAYEQARKTPGGRVALQRIQDEMRGGAVDDIYRRTGLGEMKSELAASPNLSGDVRRLEAGIAASNLPPEQAVAKLRQRAKQMGPAAEARVEAALAQVRLEQNNKIVRRKVD